MGKTKGDDILCAFPEWAMDQVGNKIPFPDVRKKVQNYLYNTALKKSGCGCECANHTHTHARTHIPAGGYRQEGMRYSTMIFLIC